MSEPTSAIIILGNAIFFKPESDVMAVSIFSREKFSTSLESAEAVSLKTLHIVVKASEFSSLFDPDALATFNPKLAPGAEVVVHALNSGGAASDSDVETIKMSCVLAGLKVESDAESEDGSRIVTGKKPSD